MPAAAVAYFGVVKRDPARMRAYLSGIFAGLAGRDGPGPLAAGGPGAA